MRRRRLPSIACWSAIASRSCASCPTASVDLVFADPPYNLQLERDLLRPNNTVVDGVDDAWDKFSSFADYDRFSRAWLAECRRVLKPNGAIWVIGSYHNIFRLGVALQDLGFWIQNDIVWRKTNPMPNFRGKRFTNAHETLIWAGREQKSRVTFNYEAMKALNDDIQMRSDWLFPICAGPERLKDGDGPQGASDAEARGAAASRAAGHRPMPATSCSIRSSAPAPPARWRAGWAAAGSASSAIPTTPRPRSERIAKVRPLPPSTLEIAKSKRAEPRVPFGTIIELGILEPGAALTDERGRIRAEVRADGTLAVQGRQGSIHRLGAEVQGKAACNGWTFWHFEVEGTEKADRRAARGRQAAARAGAACVRRTGGGGVGGLCRRERGGGAASSVGAIALSARSQPCERRGLVPHRLADFLGHFLGVAEQHHGVVAVEQRVVDAGIARWPASAC